MQLTPPLDKVLVRLDPIESTFGDSTIIRPDIAKEKPRWGEVLAVGPGRITRKGIRVEPGVHRGQRVLVPWQVGSDVKIGGRLCVVVSEHKDILAVEE